MRIIVEGTAKEIADLVLTVQGRQNDWGGMPFILNDQKLQQDQEVSEPLRRSL